MRKKIPATAAWLVLAAVFILGGCASKRPAQPKEVIQKISLIPVMPPASLYTKNDLFIPFAPPLPVHLASTAANRNKSAEFNQKMESTRLMLGSKLTSAIQEELQSAGFEVTVLNNVERHKDDPEDIDYAKLPTRNAVLHVWFSDVSMYSSRMSSVYLPRMNVSTHLLPRPESEDAVYSETLYYGADSRGDKYWSIPSDPKYSYPSFNEMIDRADDVAQGYEAGLQAIAKRLSRELRK